MHALPSATSVTEQVHMQFVMILLVPVFSFAVKGPGGQARGCLRFLLYFSLYCALSVEYNMAAKHTFWSQPARVQMSAPSFVNCTALESHLVRHLSVSL